MILDNVRSALVLAPHTDDEISCAGTIARLVEQGAEVICFAFSRCVESVPKGFESNVLVQEFYDSSKSLGITNHDVDHFPVRHFPAHRQKILDAIIDIRNTIQPDLVLLPASFDIHQDHHVIYEEGVRAFKHTIILGYEQPQNSVTNERLNSFISLTDKHLSAKIDAMACYKSQAHRPYSNPDFIRALARVRGVQCGTEWAEAFETIRMVAR